MPHRFGNGPRLRDLSAASADVRRQFRWETINAVVCKIGGLVFFVDSELFAPGACIDVLQIFQGRSKLTMQLMNLTAITRETQDHVHQHPRPPHLSPRLALGIPAPCRRA